MRGYRLEEKKKKKTPTPYSTWACVTTKEEGAAGTLLSERGRIRQFQHIEEYLLIGGRPSTCPTEIDLHGAGDQREAADIRKIRLSAKAFAWQRASRRLHPVQLPAIRRELFLSYEGFWSGGCLKTSTEVSRPQTRPVRFERSGMTRRDAHFASSCSKSFEDQKRQRSDNVRADNSADARKSRLARGKK